MRKLVTHNGAAWALATCLSGVSFSAQASNCVVAFANLTADPMHVGDVLTIDVRCAPSEAECASAASIALEVTQGGHVIAGTTEVIGSTDAFALLRFRPRQSFAAGDYSVRVGLRFPQDLRFRVDLDHLVGIDTSKVELQGAVVWKPAGKILMCPSGGEGDCDPAVYGSEGERQVVELQVKGVPHDDTVASRFIPDGDAKPMSPFQIPYQKRVAIGAVVEEARSAYCGTLELWNLANDQRQSLHLCAEDLVVAKLETRAQMWSGLSRCSAPPVLGGWGYDVWGVPSPEHYLVPTEDARKAWCQAKSACASANAAIHCLHYEHYCPTSADVGAADAGQQIADEADPAEEEDAEAAVDDVVADDVGKSGPSAKEDHGCSAGGGFPAGGLSFLIALAGLRRRRR